MITDFNSPRIGAQLTADICIVGAGAAGITIAHKLIASGLQVVVIESGGSSYEPETEALNELAINDNIDSNVAGVKFDRGRSCRLRFFGGTTNHWSGWCRPLDPLDFEARKWVPGSGWPISISELTSYYQEAQVYCDLNSPVFEPQSALTLSEKLPLFHGDKIESIFWTLSTPTRFGAKYRDQLEQAQNISVVLHANAIDIETDTDESSVTAVKVRSLQGKQANIIAKKYVIACGALENARLLLASKQKNPNGVGNRSGMVGKNYQNHPHIHTAIISAADPEALSEIYRPKYLQTGNGLRTGLTASETAQRQAEILNFAATIQPVAGISTAREMWNDLKALKIPDDFSYKVKAVIGDFLNQRKDMDHQVYMYTEQAPNEHSKIVLMDELDQLGMPKIRLDWQLNTLDKRTVRSGTQLIAEELGRLNIGRLRVKNWVRQDDKKWPPSLWGGCHHIGTTRMSGDPENGVTDANCKVHDLDNLYLSGSSLFPTGGHAPPTFTIVALALRLADHLQK